MTTGEPVDIQPQPGPDEDYERFNWDAPILVSPHQPSRIYFASQRVWRSDDRGDSWTAISGDLTRDQERVTLPIMGRVQSWDNAWDVLAMSNYNTITALAESPIQEGLIYAGTDDGLIQVTEDGGTNWRTIEVGSLPDVPATAYVNDIKADLYDADVAYVALDDHKSGNFAPYLLKTSDRGRSWTSITGNLPERTLVWRLVQDHVEPDLLFAGTEFGLYFTTDGGQNWYKFLAGVPTISFRDLAIQRRENDLVGASFGRSYYVLDDYTPLRSITDSTFVDEATLFKPRDAWWYFPRPDLSTYNVKGSQGDAYFTAENPPFGVVLTYHLRDTLKTRQVLRQDAEKKIGPEVNVPFPGWEALEDEKTQDAPRILLTVSDSDGNVVRRLSGPVESGFHRIAWDLRYPPNAALSVGESALAEGSSEGVGFMVAPGTYSAQLSKQVDGVQTDLAGPVTFDVVPLRSGALEGSTPDEVAAFWGALSDATGRSSAVQMALRNEKSRVETMQKALLRATAPPGDLDTRLHTARAALLDLDSMLSGNPAKREMGEKTRPTVLDRLLQLELAVGSSTYGPTPTHRQSLDIVLADLNVIQAGLEEQRAALEALGRDLQQAGAPYIEGGDLPR
jgi:photosystem II stability/assembly factor-like uncharacterized protein